MGVTQIGKRFYHFIDHNKEMQQLLHENSSQLHLISEQNKALTDVTYMMWHFLGMIPLALVVGLIYIKARRLVPIMIVHYIMDVMTVVGVLTLSLQPSP